MDTAAPRLNSRAFLIPRSDVLLSFLPTARGLLLILFAVGLLLGPVVQEDDIVSSALAWCFLALFLLIAFGTAAQGVLARKHLSAAPTILPDPRAGNRSENLTSNSPCRFVVRVSPLSLMPLYCLTVETTFEQPGLSQVQHIFRGHSPRERYGLVEFSFPHRGEWQIGRLRAIISDQFGLTRFAWDLRPPDETIRVHPPEAGAGEIPILSSCHRPGDLVSDLKERSGDPLDLKPYHPSDGMRRILWKIYARTGELMSRHPERSISPEGQVILFALAQKPDDLVCSALVSYLRQLDDLNLEVLCGCEGMRESLPADSPERAELMLIQSVFETGRPQIEVQAELTAFIGECERELTGSTISRLIIFSSARLAATEGGKKLLTAVAEDIAARGAQPVFVLIEPPLRLSANGHKPGLVSSAVRFFVDHEPGPPKIDRLTLSGFQEVCRAAQWEVIMSAAQA